MRRIVRVKLSAEKPARNRGIPGVRGLGYGRGRRDRVGGKDRGVEIGIGLGLG
jgi:hypothetical protein